MIRKNIKIIIGIIIGIIISGSIAYAVNMASSSVSYTKSGSSVTNVEGALNELYGKADYIKYPPNSNKIFAIDNSKIKSVCIFRNGKIECFVPDNYNVESTHLQQVFSDITCGVYDSGVNCNGEDIHCDVYSSGPVFCEDKLLFDFCRSSNTGSNCS